MDVVPVQLAVTIFSGFLQKLGSPGSGMVYLENEAYVRCCGRPDVRVRLFPWNINEKDVAESLWRNRPMDKDQIHLVAGYSYGGDRAVKFIRQLALRGGCTVKELWLCDAVRRFDGLPGVAGGLGLGWLEIPSIVESCTYYWQRNPRWKIGREGGLYQPAGHTVIKSHGAKTQLHGPYERTSGHSYIDDDYGFRMGFLSALDRQLMETETLA